MGVKGYNIKEREKERDEGAEIELEMPFLNNPTSNYCLPAQASPARSVRRARQGQDQGPEALHPTSPSEQLQHFTSSVVLI
jgi:hypothetical protein